MQFRQICNPLFRTHTQHVTTNLMLPVLYINLSYLLAGIGNIVWIVICITHLYQTVSIRKKDILSNIHRCNEKKQPMEPIYKEIGHGV